MYKIKPLDRVKKVITIPPDKSISHRAIIFSAISKGKTVIENFLNCQDTQATINCLRKLGVKITQEGNVLVIEGVGKYFPKPKEEPIKLNARESGTTMRILSGLLSTQKFSVEFRGKASLNRRPMRRIVEPLRQMNARIAGKKKGQNLYPPLLIKPTNKICAAEFKLPIASAQVKSALMLAGLYADKPTVIKEPYQSRDHTERMLKLFKARVRLKERRIICYPASELVSPGKLFIPSDFSSASFFIVLGLILKNSKLLIKDVNINPSRCGLLKVLKRMGADIRVRNIKRSYEPYADLEVRSSKLKATEVKSREIATLIDEIPILCVAASFAKGITKISGLKELKVKEVDRIKSIHSILHSVGVESKSYGQDGIVVEGGVKLHQTSFKSFADHRTAMSAVILGSVIGSCTVDDIACINKSFPQFISQIESL